MMSIAGLHIQEDDTTSEGQIGSPDDDDDAQPVYDNNEDNINLRLEHRYCWESSKI